MDTFVLLPFLLLSRLPADLDIWRYGPEYTYLVNVNTTNLNDSIPYNGNTFQGLLVNATLKCRPQESDVLNCYFGDFRTTVYEDNNKYENQVGYEVWQLHEPFQIVFDRRGVRNLVVNQRLSRWNVDMMKAIVSQLNVGVDILNKPDGKFNDTESSYLGECDSCVNISHKTRKDDTPWKENFVIVPMTGFRKAYGEVVTINKNRNLDSCAYKKDYMFTGEEWGLETNVTSSRSRIVISDTSYSSCTINTIEVRNIQGDYMPLHEKIILNLISTLPAKEALPIVYHSTTINPYVYNYKLN